MNQIAVLIASEIDFSSPLYMSSSRVHSTAKAMLRKAARTLSRTMNIRIFLSL